MKRLALAVLALLLFLAATPADPVEFVFDPRIPAANQELLQQELNAAMQQNGMRGTVIISLRVIEPQPQRTALVAAK